MPRPPDVLCYVKLPDKLENGFYDQFGQPVADGARPRLVLHALPPESAPPIQCWGVFERRLEPDQYGFLIFTNVPGQTVPGGAFTEWDEAASTPTFAEDRLMVLYSTQRALGAARVVGRNAAEQPVAAAAGLLFVAPHAAKAPVAREAPERKAARAAPGPKAARAAQAALPPSAAAAAPLPGTAGAQEAAEPGPPPAAPEAGPAAARPKPGPPPAAPEPGPAAAPPKPGRSAAGAARRHRGPTPRRKR
jgi:hypothetical protein